MYGVYEVLGLGVPSRGSPLKPLEGGQLQPQRLGAGCGWRRVSCSFLLAAGLDTSLHVDAKIAIEVDTSVYAYYTQI